MELKKISITLAIAVLFTAFILVAVDAFYPRPKYEDFCSRDMGPRPLSNEEAKCDYSQTQEEYDCVNGNGLPKYKYDSNGCRVFDKCDYCNKKFEQASSKYENALFLILAPLGAIAILLGVSYKIDFIGSGFMFSGIILMFLGTVQNFDSLNKFLKVIVIFMELLLVLFIAYKKVIPEGKANLKPSLKKEK